MPLQSQSRESIRKSSRSAAIRAAALETLEQRQLLSATISLSSSTLYLNDVKGGGSSPSQTITIKNTGSSTLTIPSGGITLTGTDKSEFSVSAGTLPASISAGKTKSISVKFSAAAIGIRTATLDIKSNSSSNSTASVALRGLGTAGQGGNLEPSLQEILNLFQIPDKVGENNPSQTAFPIPPATPNDEVVAQQFTKAGSGSVSISLLAVFDNDKQPAATVGYYKPSGSNLNQTNLFVVPNSAHTDDQSVHPATSGSTSFDPGSSSFGLYTLFPAFNNRASYQQDALNTWDTTEPRKIRFYPLKNSNGSVVPNAYVFAAEDYNKAYDFNDVVGIIRNVKISSTSTGGGGGGGGGTTGGTGSVSNISNLGVLNEAGLPGNDRMVFNRIQHPDTVRANVTDDEDTLKLSNTGSSSMSLSISLADSSDFQFVSGGGSSTLGAGKSETVTVKFVGAGTGSTLLKVFQSVLKITANGKTDTVVLAGLWQDYSEQTPADPHHIYDEPSLSTVVNQVFGYTTDIANPGQETTDGLLVKLGTHGDRTAVGDEVFSNYWQAAGSGPVTVRMLAAFHRQNNFDPTTGAPETAASNLRYFYKGSSSSTTKLFQHNTNEGQSLLPHNWNSTSQYAEASFTPSSGKAFGFKVDSLYSDDSLNPSDFNPTTLAKYANTGHAFRFYPLKDENGKVVPNTYIMAQDYTGLSYSNYDYQDNIYIVSGIKPASTSTSSAVAESTSTKSTTANSAATPSMASQIDLTDNNSVLDTL